jgi:hypothetical protein
MNKTFKPDSEALEPVGELLQFAKVDQTTQDNALEMFKENPPIEEFALLAEAEDEEDLNEK